MATNRKRLVRPEEGHPEPQNRRMTRFEAKRLGVVLTSAEEQRKARIQEVVELLKIREEEDRARTGQEGQKSRENRSKSRKDSAENLEIPTRGLQQQETDNLEIQLRTISSRATNHPVVSDLPSNSLFFSASSSVNISTSPSHSSSHVFNIPGWDYISQSNQIQSILHPFHPEINFLNSLKWHLDLLSYTILKLIKSHSGSGRRSARILLAPNMWSILIRPLALACHAVEIPKRTGKGRHPDRLSFQSFSDLVQFFSITFNSTCLTFESLRPPYEKKVHISPSHDFQLIYCDKVVMVKFYVFKKNQSGFMGVI